MNIVTINVRGLNNPQKRQTILQWLKFKQFDIICLQETFCTQETSKLLSAEWEGPSFHSVSQSSHSKGVSILINDKFTHEIIDTHTCQDGRKILINLTHNTNIYTIANIYAPTDIPQRIHFINSTKY